MIFEVVYRIKGYSLSDAMRPNPFWGKRRFRVDSEKLGTDDIDAIKEASIATPPDDRYEFYSIQQCPGGQIVYADKEKKGGAK